MGLFDLFKKDNSPSPEKLIKAAKKGNLESVNFQLEMGTDVNCRDEKGRTPLIWASCGFWESFLPHELKVYAKIIKILLEKSADVNARDKTGRTALMFASENGWIEAAKMLMEAGADLNTKDSKGHTALLLASDYGWIEIAKMLMEAGAQIDDKDKDEVLALINGPALPLPEVSPPFPEFARKHDLSLVVDVERNMMELRIRANHCTVNWGDDSNADEYNKKYMEEKTISHRYPKAGSYIITINAEGLTGFHCYYNGTKTTAIYLNNCPQLEGLNCFANKLTSLDISRCTALKRLTCDLNKLTSLNLSNNLALDYLSCSNNLLTCLDISNHTQLREVNCSHNQLSILKVNRNSAITCFECNNNRLSKHELNRVFSQLPNYNSSYGTVNTVYSGSTSTPKVFIACNDNPGFDSCNKIIAQIKNWLVWGKALYSNGSWVEDIFH